MGHQPPLLLIFSIGPGFWSRVRNPSRLSRSRRTCANTAGTFSSRQASKPLPDFPRCSLTTRYPTSMGWVAACSLPSSKTRESLSCQNLAGNYSTSIFDNPPGSNILEGVSFVDCSVPTPTPTATATATSTPTATFTPTPTATATFTPTPTATFTPTATATFTPTPTATFTPTPTATFTPTPTPTSTPTPTACALTSLLASVSLLSWEPAIQYPVQRVGGAARLQTDGGECPTCPSPPRYSFLQ